MKNQSEATIRPAEAMTQNAIEKTLKGLTVTATFRAWFHPLDYFEDYDDGDGKGPYLCGEGMIIRGAEMNAVSDGSHIDYAIVRTDFDCNIIARREGSAKKIDLYEHDAFYAIKVLSPGVEPPETLTVGAFDEVVADPSSETITIGNVDLDGNDVDMLMGLFQRWREQRPGCF